LEGVIFPSMGFAQRLRKGLVHWNQNRIQSWSFKANWMR